MENLKPRIANIDGIDYEMRIFIGDGKAYDARWEPGDPVRRGSILLKPLIEEAQTIDTPETES